MPNSDWKLTEQEIENIETTYLQEHPLEYISINRGHWEPLGKATANAQAVKLLQYLKYKPPSFVYGTDNMRYEGYIESMLADIQEGK